jgi:hypothetical protein
MRRQGVVAFLAAVVVFAAALAHSVFACTAAAHGQLVRQTAHHTQHHDCKDDPGAPPCCQQPATTVAIQKMNRPADDVRMVVSSVLAGPALANFVGDVTTPSRCWAVTAVPTSAASLRTHLFLRTLLL